MRNTMRNWMFGTALMTGLFAAGAAGAQAQVRDFHRGVAPVYRDRGYERPVVRDYYRPGFQVGVAVGAPVVADDYIPPCPGDGYVWTAGYYNAGVWVPGRWAFRGGYGVAHVDRPEFGHGYARGFDRGAGRGFGRR